jgi:hypothetical protein
MGSLLLLIAAAYPWLSSVDPGASLQARIPPPARFVRETLAADSFGAWLRGLPLLPGRPPVQLYDGRLKRNQSAHAAVVDIDVGARDLQQCADAVIRLRAEYLYASGKAEAIRFHFTSGDLAEFSRWSRGERPQVNGAHVRWAPSAAPDRSHASLRGYLDSVFTYAGSKSLESELSPLEVSQLTAGDVFISGGFPGHAVLVVDTVIDPRSHRRAFLLAQSYMPAQQIQILRNPAKADDDPWYDLDFGSTLVTPEWTFPRSALRCFRPSD